MSESDNKKSSNFSHWIAGSPVKPMHGAFTLQVTSPLDGNRLAEIEIANTEVLNTAVQAAQEAFRGWSTTPVKKRVQVLYRFKQLVEQNMDELSKLVEQENGKLFSEAQAELEKGLEVVEYACSIPNMKLNAILEVSAGVDCFTRLKPLGVVAGITPFNFPGMVPMWMFPIAIACGNTFILKPSEQVPLTPLRLAELLKEAGLPDGVFNVVQGDKSTVNGILEHPDIKAVAFVGSTRVARLVYNKGNEQGKRTLALGGAKNHLVVVPDADPEVTAGNIVASFTGCAGQRCMAASVLISVGDCTHILERVKELAAAIEAGKDMGSVISVSARERIEKYITEAEESGARILVDGRGEKVDGKANGTYVGPTIIDGVSPDAPCACDEIFGPVLTVLHVDTLEEAIAIENANPYGNAAAIYTSNGGTARLFSERASAGMIGINIGVPVPREPFSFGGWNDSRFGQGDITGEYGISFWTQTKKITQKWSASAAQNWMS